MSTADAVAREAEWLRTSGDGLPALLTEDGGPWDLVQAYAPRTPPERKASLYVMRRGFHTRRWSQQRRMAGYDFHLVCLWPIGQTTVGVDMAENEQAAFDQALMLLVERIEGYVDDKSHGARFLAVAEGDASNSTRIEVEFQDPGESLSDAFLAATITYSADDTDYVM